LPLDDRAAALLTPAARARLGRFAGLLVDAEWTAAALEAAARVFVEAEGGKLGDVAQPLRAALTGAAVSPGVFEVLEVLGRDEAMARIDDAVAAPRAPD